MPNPLYDYQNFTGWNFTAMPEYVWSNRTVIGSCFSQETPDSVIFATGTRNIIFKNCNLDNVKLPTGSTVINCTTRRFKVQNDHRDWEIDALNVPIRVINEKYWDRAGYSIDPADLPQSPLTRQRTIEETLEPLKRSILEGSR